MPDRPRVLRLESPDRRKRHAREALIAICLDERPALLEMRNHLTNTFVAFDGQDDATIAYLRDLGQSLHNVVLAIDRVALADRDFARAKRGVGPTGEGAR